MTTGITNGQVPTADFRAQLLAARLHKTILDYYPLPTCRLPAIRRSGSSRVSPTTSDDNIVAKGDYMISSNRPSLRYHRLHPNNSSALPADFPATTGVNERSASFPIGAKLELGNAIRLQPHRRRTCREPTGQHTAISKNVDASEGYQERTFL